MPSFTNKAIKEAFIKLLEQYPLKQISVKDIVEECGINRNSFYYHFADIPSLINEIMVENADRIIEEYAGADSLEKCLTAAAQFALRNKKSVLHVYKSASRELVELQLMKICEHVVSSYGKAVFGGIDIDERDREILQRFYKCELFGQIIDWLNCDMRYDIQSQFSRLCEIQDSITASAIQKCISK